jgi:dihydroorotase
MIDPHVHCRDGNQSYKETIAHALSVAYRAGVSAIFDMPNTDPPITTYERVIERLDIATMACSPVFYGLYVGVTADPYQIKDVVQCHKKFFRRMFISRDGRAGVVGLKMYGIYPGKFAGDLAVVKEEEQQRVYKTLAKEGYDGVLVVHCEKESLFKPELWKSSDPVSHSYARPPQAEVESVKDQIRFATGYKFPGQLHIAHVSVPESVELVKRAKKAGKIKISCGVTPHHLILNTEMQSRLNCKKGLLYKVNPPLRPKSYGTKLMEFLELPGHRCFIATQAHPEFKSRLGDSAPMFLEFVRACAK